MALQYVRHAARRGGGGALAGLTRALASSNAFPVDHGAHTIFAHSSDDRQPPGASPRATTADPTLMGLGGIRSHLSVRRGVHWLQQDKWRAGPGSAAVWSSSAGTRYASSLSAETSGSSVEAMAGGSRVWEVAGVAASAMLPIAFLEHIIEHVHVSAGLPWWGAIVATTVAIRCLILPVSLYQMRAAARLTMVKPELQQITEKVKRSGYDPAVVGPCQKQMKELFKKHGTSPWAPFAGVLVQAPVFISFFFAIQEMAAGLPSFATGGALWFTDLSTPDDLYIMPILTGMSFLINVELGAAEGMEGQPNATQAKMVLRLLAVGMVPFMASFPKALFCYWLTTNLVSLAQAQVLRRPAIRKFLGMPDQQQMAAAIAAATETKGAVAQAPAVLFQQPKTLRNRSNRNPTTPL